MLNHVADFYDDDVNVRSTALLSWVEPVILIVVAVFIAFILISLYMPIFSIRGFGLEMKEIAETKQKDRETARHLAERYHYEFVELKGVHLDLDSLPFDPGRSDVPVQLCAITPRRKCTVVAMADPSDLVVIDEVSALLGRPLVINVAPLSEIQDLLKKSESSQRMLEEATEGFKLDLIREERPATKRSPSRKITQEESSPIIRLVDTIIFTALEGEPATFISKRATTKSV